MMKPALVVLPGLEEEQVTIGGNGGTIPYACLRLDDGSLLSRWELDAEDRKRIAEGGDVYLYIWTGGKPQQPVMITTNNPLS